MNEKDFLYEYNRKRAVNYARRWALGRNPKYADFHEMGGDCTNFASQVIHAGDCPMNYHKYGWYYHHLNNRSPSWTSVEYLYQFLVNNQGVGPVGEKTDIYGLEVGDIVQLGFDKKELYHHTPVVIGIKPGIRRLDRILIGAHTLDRIDYPLSNYSFEKIRFIHIKGYRR